MKKNFNNYFLPIVSLVFFSIALFIHSRNERPEIVISKQESATNINRDFLKSFSGGHKRLLSSFLWIITLQEADTVKYQKKDMNSWMYHRFRTIAELEPKFYQNYLYGGMFLSIIKDDLEGAADIYERGLKLYPEDYSLNYNAGFNYYFEMGNFEKGLEKLAKVENHPRAPWTVKFLVNKLRFETSSDYDSALEFLKLNYQNVKDEELKVKLASDIYALKAERDLECLNQNEGSCETIDAEGKPYILKEDKWTTQRPFSPYKIHLRKKKGEQKPTP